ncbi:hypothetical protein FNO01nite_06570 [Flavobacterium noncentrifugens]|uniref:DUF4349 domain-containing protein n=1 Tax=Flavobacterium noncentrifugens TaxID=1128970 RepID=A0A1G8SVR0_9FLAO|nr:DUF4349 domain-containing protein [Flavobacterium noncentrifugens]GEP49985.1 hypothetical protein FNO01nite_06570 [Flavobacterium noncentrifugens]SDJ33293.1 protein of unknown function [Flavobacterium noncentrifugens]
MKTTLPFLIFLLFCFSACTKHPSEETYDSKISSVRLPASDLKKDKVASDSDKKIIRNANLKFQSENPEETYLQIGKTAKKCNAIIENDNQEKSDSEISRTLIIRVPSQNFEPFLSEIGKGVAYFDTREITSSDVTEQYIDSETRLKNKRVLETRYLELLKKAGKVSEILEIEKELSDVREEIESKEAQLKYLQSQVSMSAITISFYKPVAHGNGVTISYGSKMWNAVAEGFYGFSGFLLGLLYIWPFITILVVLFFVFRKKLRRRKTL